LHQDRPRLWRVLAAALPAFSMLAVVGGFPAVGAAAYAYRCAEYRDEGSGDFSAGLKHSR